MTDITYMLMLDDLNQMTAQYVWVAQQGEDVVRLSLPRHVWEDLNRPGQVEVEVRSR